MVRNRERLMRRLLAASQLTRLRPGADNTSHDTFSLSPMYDLPADKNSYLLVTDRSSALPYGLASADTLAAGQSQLIGRGFPRAQQPVHEWIPGISTPEGIILSSSAVGLTLLMAPDLFERVVSGTATVVLVGVSTGIPAVAVWFGTGLTGH